MRSGTPGIKRKWPGPYATCRPPKASNGPNEVEKGQPVENVKEGAPNSRSAAEGITSEIDAENIDIDTPFVQGRNEGRFGGSSRRKRRARAWRTSTFSITDFALPAFDTGMKD